MYRSAFFTSVQSEQHLCSQLKTTIYYSHLQITFLVSKQTSLCNTCSETNLKMLFLKFKYFNKTYKNLQSSSCRYYVLISDQIMECTTNHSFIKVVKIYGPWNWFHLTYQIIRLENEDSSPRHTSVHGSTVDCSTQRNRQLSIVLFFLANLQI